MGVEMQFSSLGRLRVMRRMVGRGKVIRQFVTGGRWVVNCGCGGEDMVDEDFVGGVLWLELERDREGVW